MSVKPYILIPTGAEQVSGLTAQQLAEISSIPFLQTAVNSATSDDSYSTIVKRSATGDFDGRVISATTLVAPSVTTTSINSIGSVLNIADSGNTQTVNVGCSTGVQIVNVGTNSGGTTINLGGIGDEVVVQGTLVTVDTTNLSVTDKNIILNMSGSAGSAFGAGISVMENGITGAASILVSPDRSGWIMKSPAGTTVNLNQSLLTTDDVTFGTITGNLNGTITSGTGSFSSLSCTGTSLLKTVNCSSLSCTGAVTASGIRASATARKILTLTDLGTPATQTQQNYDGFGNDATTVIYQAKNVSTNHTFYAANSSTSSNGLMRVNGSGVVDFFKSIAWGGTSNTMTQNKFLAFRDYGSLTDTSSMWFTGFGAPAGQLSYQLAATTDAHVFNAWTGSGQRELMRISGDGNVTVLSGLSADSITAAGNISSSGTVTSLTGVFTNLSCSSFNCTGTSTSVTSSAGTGVFTNLISSNITLAGSGTITNLNCSTLNCTGAAICSSFSATNDSSASYTCNWDNTMSGAIQTLYMTRKNNIVYWRLSNITTPTTGSGGSGTTSCTPGIAASFLSPDTIQMSAPIYVGGLYYTGTFLMTSAGVLYIYRGNLTTWTGDIYLPPLCGSYAV